MGKLGKNASSKKVSAEYADLQKAWAGTSPRERMNFDPLPAGPYQFELTKARVDETKNGNSRRIFTSCVVIGGDHAGRIFPKNWKLDDIELKAVGRSKTKEKVFTPDPKGLQALMTDVITLRIAASEAEARKLNPLTDVHSKMDGLTFEGAIVESTTTDRDGKPYLNLYINGLINDDDRRL